MNSYGCVQTFISRGRKFPLLEMNEVRRRRKGSGVSNTDLQSKTISSPQLIVSSWEQGDSSLEKLWAAPALLFPGDWNNGAKPDACFSCCRLWSEKQGKGWHWVLQERFCSLPTPGTPMWVIGRFFALLPQREPLQAHLLVLSAFRLSSWLVQVARGSWWGSGWVLGRLSPSPVPSPTGF